MTAFFFMAGLGPFKTSSHFWTGLYWGWKKIIRQTISTMIRRRSVAPPLGDRASPFPIAGPPFAADHSCQTSDFATVGIKRPIQHLALELHLTKGAHPFGPRAAAGTRQSSFRLSNFLIQHLEHIDPDHKPLLQPRRY